MPQSPLPATIGVSVGKPLSAIFTGVHDEFHNADGNVKVVSLTDGSKILRLENLSTNGPNVHVYLSTDKHATDYDLGKLKANNGNQNYDTTGSPDDYAVEVASGAWFGSLVWPGAVGLVVGGPIGLAAGVAVGGIMAYEFEKHIWERVLEVVKKESAVQPTIDSVNHYND